MPHGLTVSTDALESARAVSEVAPHFAVFGSIVHASRACRIDVRDKPGGEPTTFARDLNLAAVGGVEGAVRKVLLSKRHGLLKGWQSWPTAADEIVVFSDISTLHASRACRTAACDFPSGEAGVCVVSLEAATGVAGMVSKVLPPNRQRLPKPRVSATWLHSELDKPDESSVSDALPCPMSVVDPSSSTSLIVDSPAAFANSGLEGFNGGNCSSTDASGKMTS